MCKSPERKQQLTQSSLVDLFRRQGKHDQQFDHDFDHHLCHRGCGSDLGIDLESTREVFNALEDVDKGVVAFSHVFGRLAGANIINYGPTGGSESYAHR